MELVAVTAGSTAGDGGEMWISMVTRGLGMPWSDRCSLAAP